MDDFQNFNLEYALHLITEETIHIGNNKFVVKQDIDECKNYCMKYFYPCDDGQYFILHKKEGELQPEFDIRDHKTMHQVYFNKLGKDMTEWFFKKYTKLFTVVNDVHKPRVFDNKINLSSGFLHKNPKPYEEYDDDTKSKVQKMVNFLYEVWSDCDDENHEYILQCFSEICKGRKLDVCIYNKCVEGIGKSTYIDFFVEFVIGFGLCAKGTAEMITTQNNKMLCGKLFVYFEEMPTFSCKEWMYVSGKLKDMITGKKAIYSDKYLRAFEALNLNNYVINTNVEALKDKSGRRIHINPLSTKYYQNHKYFAELRDECFNMQVGEAFFAYLLSIDTKGFNAQRAMPDNDNKRREMSYNIPTEYKFIKKNYVLQKRSIFCSLQELFDEYLAFCTLEEGRSANKHKFVKCLEELQIKYYKSNTKNMYKVDYETLKALADKRKWICDLDEEGESDLDTSEKKINNLVQENNKLNKYIQDLEQRLALLEQKTKYEKVIDIIVKKQLSIEDVINTNEEMKKYIQECQTFAKTAKKQKPKEQKPKPHKKFGAGNFQPIDFDVDDEALYTDDTPTILDTGDNSEDEDEDKQDIQSDDDLELEVSFN